MNQETKNRLSGKDKKTDSITARCTPETKKKTQTKDNNTDATASDFALNCTETGLKRNTKWHKHMVKRLVEMQEDINQEMKSLSPGQQERKDILMGFSKGVMGLWEF